MSGRLPALSGRGRLLAATALLLLLLGALAPASALAALGLLLLGLLFAVYLAFIGAASQLWRRQIELLLTVRAAEEGALVAGRRFAIELVVRNRGPHRLPRLGVRPLVSTAIQLLGGTQGEGDPEIPGPTPVTVNAAEEVRLVVAARALAAGPLVVHGAAVSIADPLALVVAQAYFPSSLPLKVLPRRAVSGAAARRPVGGGDERAGPRAGRQRGLGGELRELREHAPGDPFKHIAWKATARSGRLMVRDLDRETLLTHHLLVDASPGMRQGAPGGRPLDGAVELAAALAARAVDDGDQVGLVAFDGALRAHVPPGGGPSVRGAIIDQLVNLLAPVDDEATDLTDAELVAAVARYLRHQEGTDARVQRAPPIDDPAWGRLAAGPQGELYDLDLLAAAIAGPLRSPPPLHRSAVAASEAAEPEMARLRRYCRRRGIELPTRLQLAAGRRARALVAALDLALREVRGGRVILLAELPLEGAGDELGRRLALARRRGVRVEWYARLTGDGRSGDPVVDEVLGWETKRRERAAWRRLETLGVHLLPLLATLPYVPTTAGGEVDAVGGK